MIILYILNSRNHLLRGVKVHHSIQRSLLLGPVLSYFHITCFPKNIIIPEFLLVFFGWDTNIYKYFKSVLQIMLITSLYLPISYLKFMIEFTGFSMVSDSQGPTDFSAQLGFSEDSNSQSSEPSSKRLKTDCS